MIYYQLIIRFYGTPYTIKRKHRSITQAQKRMSYFISQGETGCMVTINRDTNGLVAVKEF